MGTLNLNRRLMIIACYLGACTKSRSFVVIAAHTIGVWWALATIAATFEPILHVLETCLRTSLSHAHPVGSTHDPSISMVVLMAQRANTTINQSLYSVRRLWTHKMAFCRIIIYSRAHKRCTRLRVKISSKWIILRLRGSHSKRSSHHKLAILDWLLTLNLFRWPNPPNSTGMSLHPMVVLLLVRFGFRMMRLMWLDAGYFWGSWHRLETLF